MQIQETVLNKGMETEKIKTVLRELGVVFLSWNIGHVYES